MESNKGGSRWESEPGHLACAASALPLSYNKWTTTSPHNPLIYTAQVGLKGLSHTPGSHSVCAVRTLGPGPSKSWRAKVSDYGSANFLQQLRTAGPGNPTYAAPEADIPSQQSPKMDVYSYGVLLLEMCSRRFPNPEECEALLQRVQQPTMVALIRQCMERQPTRRPAMSDIIGQLE